MIKLVYLRINPRLCDFMKMPTSQLIEYIEFISDVIKEEGYDITLMLDLQQAKGALVIRN